MKTGLIKKLLATSFLLSQLSFAGVIESDIGKGILQYDKAAGLKDRCLRLDSTDIYSVDSRITAYTLDLVSNKEELYDRISIKSDGSGSYGVFSAEAKTKFVKEIKWNFNSNYILVRAMRITKKLNISAKNLLLTDYSTNLLLDSKFKFLESCGNSFANSINLGGEVYGLIEIQASTYHEKQEIETSISASGAYTGGKASGSLDYKRLIEKLSSEYKVKVAFQHVGGQAIAVPNTVEGLLQLSNQIEEITDAHPVPISIETRDYSTISNYVLDIDSYPVKIRQDNITYAEGKLKNARNLYSRILYILENPNDFKRFNESELKMKLAYLDEKNIELRAFIAKSSSFLNESDVNKISIDLNFELPEMKRRATRSELKIKCVERQNPICGVASYKKIKSSACGVVGANLGTGPSCGTIFREASSPACGVKSFNVKADPKCGALTYSQCHHKDCGTNWDGSRKRCRTQACGAETFKSCEDASFGPKEFNSCRHETHGPEKFLTCKHKDFGYEFESCEHLSHGAETFNICEIAKIGSQETFCPEF